MGAKHTHVLRHLRQLRGWSQEDVARALDTNAFTISRWERGIAWPSPHFRQKLSELFQVSPQELGIVPEHTASERQSTLSVPGWLPSLPQVVQSIGLIGRESLLSSLRDMILSPNTNANIALHGMPGVGKTAIALALIHDSLLRQHFIDGILWVGLGPKPDLRALLNSWGLQLALSHADLAQCESDIALGQLLHRAIGQRRMLIVIDDAWRIEDALAFQIGGPGCKHLVTTRFPLLGIGFSHQPSLLVEELPSTDGIALLQALAPATAEQQPHDVHDLVVAVGGLPLALILIGFQLQKAESSGQSRRVRATLQALQNPQTRLDLQEPTSPLRSITGLQRGNSVSLKSIIAASSAVLSEKARELLAQCTLFPAKPNYFSEEAASALSGLPIDEFLQVIDMLVDVGLVEAVEGEYFTLHQVIADFATPNALSSSALLRLVEYYIAFFEQWQHFYPVLQREVNNILAIIERIHGQHLYQSILAIVEVYRDFLQSQGLVERLLPYLQESVDLAERAQDQPLIMSGLAIMAEVAINRGHFGEAASYLQKSLNLENASQYVEQYLRVMHLAGVNNMRQGNYTEASRYFLEGIRLVPEAESLEKIRFLNSLGNLSWKMGDFEEAERYYQTGLNLTERSKKGHFRLGLMNGIGTIAARRRQSDLAAAYFTAGLHEAETQQNMQLLCVFHNNLAGIEIERENYLVAEHHLSQALEIINACGYFVRLPTTLSNLGELALRRREWAKARAFFEQSLRLCQIKGDPEHECEALLGLGQLFYAKGNFNEAEEHFLRSLEIATSINSAYLITESQRHLKEIE